MAWKKIHNKYPALCSRCRGKLDRGAVVWYDRHAGRGNKIRCLACGAGVDVPVQPAPVPASSPAPAPVVTEVRPDDAGLAAAIATAIGPLVKGAVDEAAVRSIVDEAVGPAVEAAVQRVGVKRIEIKIPDRPAFDATGKHPRFTALVRSLALRQHVWLVGPAGSGKTTAAEQAAAALGLEFRCQSVGEQTSVYQLMGHVGPDGAYHRTLFRDAYERGGLFLLDEVDGGNANVLTSLNAAIANGSCAFPDGMVARHPDFVLVAAGNTWGLGANRVYVGRNPIDGATIDRFVFLEWGYDDRIEASMAGDQTDWCSYVQACRHSADRLGVRHIVSPRAVRFGAELLAAGAGWDEASAMALWKGLPADQIAKVKAGLEEG